MERARGHWYVKEYFGDLGCVDEKRAHEPACTADKFWLKQWIKHRIMSVPENCRRELRYRMFEPEGKEVVVEIDWVPQVHLHDV